MAGRGFGKTLAGAVATNEVARAGITGTIHLIGDTAADVRDVMVEGSNSGILAVSSKEFRPVYEPSKRRLTWPNGVTATCFSAEKFEALRGPQCGFIWADEIGKWRYDIETWDQAMLGLRIGKDPWAMVTTTPKPTALVRDLIDDEHTFLTHGTTYDNLHNLADAFRNQVIKRYEGTRLGQQELYAQLLTEAAGALWKLSELERTRIRADEFSVQHLVRIVVAIDPAITAIAEGGRDEPNETGIVVAGMDGNGHGYILEDVSGVYTPDAWAQAARGAFHRWGADRIVAERNQGGEMVERMIRQVQAPYEHLPVSTVWASRGKHTRAEPVAALWEQERGHLVGSFPKLESQLTFWEPGDTSPDRLDAMVWAMTELFFAPTVSRDLANLPVN